MKDAHLGIALLISTLFIVTGCEDKHSTSSQILRVEPLAQNLGDINRGDSVPFRLLLRNVSRNPLIIVRVHPSCTCAEINFKPTTLAPGANTYINGSLNSAAHQGDFGVTVTVDVKDPEGQKLSVEAAVGGRSVTALVAEPASIEFGPTIVNAPKIDKSVDLSSGGKNASWDDIQILRGTLPEFIQASFVRTGKMQLTLRVVLNPEGISELGPFKGFVYIRLLNHGMPIDEEPLAVPISGSFCYPSMTVSPNAIYLGEISVQKSISGAIHIIGQKGLTMSLSEIGLMTPSEIIKMDANAMPRSNRSEIGVHYVITPLKSGGISTILILKIKQGKDRFQIKLPIVGFAKV